MTQQEKKKQTFMDAFVVSKKKSSEEENQVSSSPNVNVELKDTTANNNHDSDDPNTISNNSKEKEEDSVKEIDLEAAEKQAVLEAQQTAFPDVEKSNNGNNGGSDHQDTSTVKKNDTEEEEDMNVTSTNPFDEEDNDEEKALVVYHQTSSSTSLQHDDETPDKDADKIVVWNQGSSNGNNISPKRNVRHAKIPFQKKYSDIPSNSDHNKKTKFQVGDYEISIPRTKAPWVGLIASGLILIASLLFKDEIIQTKLATYGYVLASVGIVGGILQLILPLSENGDGVYINYFLFVWCFVGACIMTFKPGHFVQTGNGYFASWGMVVFVAMGADPPGGDSSSLAQCLLDNLNSTMKLGAVSVLFIVSLATEFHHGIEQYKGEAVYAICIAVITVFLVILFSIWKYIQTNVTVSIGEVIVWILIAVSWIIAAVIVTFRGPFDTMGNGYFSSWIGASIAFNTSTSAWKAHSRDVAV
jgi:hypothetical protein